MIDDIRRRIIANMVHNRKTQTQQLSFSPLLPSFCSNGTSDYLPSLRTFILIIKLSVLANLTRREQVSYLINRRNKIFRTRFDGKIDEEITRMNISCLIINCIRDSNRYNTLSTREFFCS